MPVVFPIENDDSEVAEYMLKGINHNLSKKWSLEYSRFNDSLGIMHSYWRLNKIDPPLIELWLQSYR